MFRLHIRIVTLMAKHLLNLFHQESDPEERMEMLLEYAQNLDIHDFITTPQDIIKGNIKLNTAFVAYLFDCYPSLENEVYYLIYLRVIWKSDSCRTFVLFCNTDGRQRWTNEYNIHTRIVGGQRRHKITIYGNGLSVYIHIWQMYDVTNHQPFT